MDQTTIAAPITFPALSGSISFLLFLLLFTGHGALIREKNSFANYFTLRHRNEYLNHQLFKVTIHKIDELNLLKLWRMQYKHLHLDFWDDSLPTNLTPKKRDFLIRVPPQSVEEFAALLTSSDVDFQILSHDLKRLIQWEKFAIPDAVSQRGLLTSSGVYQSYRRVLLPGIQTLSTYLPLESVYDFIDSISARYPLMASAFELGRSYEGRPIRGLKIGTPFANFKETNFQAPDSGAIPLKYAVVIDGAMQGREWITVPTLLYLTQQLLAKYEIDEDVRLLLDYYDWYIIPVVNPDGYNYSWTTDRFWKKTRSVSILNSTLVNPQCRGVDLNRNFAYNWGRSDDPDSGIYDVCQRSFAGDKPFSERESIALAKFIFNNRKQIKAYITLQNYGQTILIPYASKHAISKDNRDHILAANVAARAMRKVYGEQYDLGSWSETLFEAGGTAVDWAYEVAKIKYTYQFQLRDRANWGFLLPRNQIIPTAAEFYAGVTELLRFIHFYEMRHEI
ncbi:carboxypeptidase B-like [Paramacrobiotus metropolitanus]|uniref:carboxypeptidase B-like n=1 Tax=Paramacrobiotus metropolitanus TaxID=2943436 RepID=UPI0024460D2B|nr:carboxypeptidase B-like [Paramacrobiotus metropolitanus]XP_055328961.1 carboxypeptidase B-like [Paramacrobiotus metropolitanus]